MSKAENCAFGLESMLLIISLTNSREPVGLDTSKVTIMCPLEIVICILLGSSLSVRYSYTTVVWRIFSCLSKGISLKQTTLKVPIPLILYFLGPTVSLPIPWHNLPNSFEYEVFHVSFNVGCRRSCLCSKSLPDSSSKTCRASRTCGAGVHQNSKSSLGCLRLADWDGCTATDQDQVQWATECSGTLGGTMGGTIGGADGGTGSCRARVRCATGCCASTAGISTSTSTIVACGRSTLAGFCTLGAGGCTLGGRWSSHLSFLLGWGSVGSWGAVSRAQSLIVFCRYWRAQICSPDREDEAPWRAAVNFYSPWRTLWLKAV